MAAAFGVATATMNVIFYAAISLLPLGTTVSLEFLGPVVVVADRGAGPAREEPRRPGTQRPTRERKTTAARGLDSAVSTRRTHWDRLSSW